MAKFTDRFDRQKNKIRFYLTGLLQDACPDQLFARQLPDILNDLKPEESDYILDRVNYYNGLSQPFSLPDDAIRKSDFSSAKSKAYYYDMRRVVRYFPDDIRFSPMFGDIVEVPEQPHFLKSRPIARNNALDNANSVLLKLNSVRHYYHVKDELAFEQKADRAVWRGKVYREWRQKFVTRFHDHPLCDVGHVDTKKPDIPGLKAFMGIRDQLEYKYIISIEGNDVATNLKWIMASGSVAMMSQPKYETWFMEGRLEPGVHYIGLADELADLEEQLEYYNQRPDEVREIIHNANQHFQQFMNHDRERLISLLVMKKYLELSGQI